MIADKIDVLRDEVVSKIIHYVLECVDRHVDENTDYYLKRGLLDVESLGRDIKTAIHQELVPPIPTHFKVGTGEPRYDYFQVRQDLWRVCFGGEIVSEHKTGQEADKAWRELVNKRRNPAPTTTDKQTT